LTPHYIGEFLHTGEKLRYEAQRVVTLDWRASFSPSSFPSTDFCAPRAGLRLLRDAAWVNAGLQVTPTKAEKARSPLIVYISRGDAKARKVANEAALITALNLTAHEMGGGLELFMGSKMGLNETVRLFGRANLVVGPHGSGLANAVFARDSGLIEIGLAATRNLIFYAHLSAALDLRYAYLVAKQSHQGDTASGLRGGMLAGIAEIISTAKAFLAA